MGTRTKFELIQELGAHVTCELYLTGHGTVDAELIASLLDADDQAKRSTDLEVDYQGPRVRECVRAVVGAAKVTATVTRPATPDDLVEYAAKMRAQLSAGGATVAKVVGKIGGAS